MLRGPKNAVMPERAPPLLAQLHSRLTLKNALHLAGGGGIAVLRLVCRWLSCQPASDVLGLLLRGITCDSTRQAVLHVWQDESLPWTESAEALVVRCLTSAEPAIRRAAVDVIVRRCSDSARHVLSIGVCARDPAVWSRLCLAENPELILPLMREMGFPHRRPAPGIGLLATPEWLAAHAATAPAEVACLIRECGYSDEPCSDGLCELLSLGFSHVGPSLLSTGNVDVCRGRVRTLMWRLLPDSADWDWEAKPPPDPRNALETELFLAAVRDTDRLRFGTRRLRPAWDRDSPLALGFHAPARYLRRCVLEEGIALARHLAVSTDDDGEFLLDFARGVLETEPELRLAADRALRTRWRLRSRPSWDSAADLILIGYRPPCEGCASPGAQSVTALADWMCVGAEFADWLHECESRWRYETIPMGIELQVPIVDPDHYGAWKAALPILGIDSPVRPEFHGMVEASIRPARSCLGLQLVPHLLHRAGLITVPQDMALHVSLNGDLGARARLLAFPQLFLHPSTRLRNRPEAVLTRVMSKGLVHRSEDAVILPGGIFPTGSTVRTEIRVYRVFCDPHSAGTRMAETHLDDLLAAQLLGTAMQNGCPQCRGLAADYEARLRTLLGTLPPMFLGLFESSFYEATGEPRDMDLLSQLPVFRAWSSVRTWVRTEQASAWLEALFLAERGVLLDRLQDHFQAGHGIDVAADQSQVRRWIACLTPSCSDGTGSQMT